MSYSGMPKSYDAWATAGPPEHTYVTPCCGADSEDLAEVPQGYVCECGEVITDEQLVTAEDFACERAHDEPQDFDERRAEQT